jgi:hypothetical protein
MSFLALVATSSVYPLSTLNSSSALTSVDTNEHLVHYSLAGRFGVIERANRFRLTLHTDPTKASIHHNHPRILNLRAQTET